MAKTRATTDLRSAITDFVELVARATLSGIAFSLAAGVAIVAISTAAEAATPNGAQTGTLLLRSEQGYAPAPKVSTEVGIEVKGIVARTRVRQVFHNPGAEHVEGLYVFPLPEKAAVDRLRMRIGARVVEGRIEEKAQARRAYERARSEGRKAALVEQHRPNLFTNAVAQIGPGESIEIAIEYQEALAWDDGRYRLRFPLAITPRYTPAGDPMPDEPKDAEARAEAELPALRQARPAAGELLNPVDIVVVIDAGLPLAEVKSSYHDTAIEKASGHAVAVTLAREQEEADRDFELEWRVAGADAPRAAIFTHRTPEADYALLMVTPPKPGAEESAAHRRLAREMVLVIDTSGSMQGASIEQARQALQFALATLGPRDRFNVIEFNSSARPLWPQPLAATPEALREAREWVRALEARGGTEMAAALSLALDGRDTPGYLRQVIFVTDGAVGNEEALFKLIASRLGTSRLFTVGIGSAPNSHFMTRAALFGRGTFTHIGHAAEVREKMSRLFAKVEAPVLRDISVTRPDGTPVETFPARLPDLYLGEPLVVATASAPPIGTLVVTGTRGNAPWSVALTPSADAESAGVGALWARFKIAALLDEITRGADPAAIRPQVVKVALEHHLVSAYTSLVAVDLTPTAPAQDPRVAKIASTTPAGTGTLPQTDTPATLHLLLGLVALLLSATLALAARRAGARA